MNSVLNDIFTFFYVALFIFLECKLFRKGMDEIFERSETRLQQALLSICFSVFQTSLFFAWGYAFIYIFYPILKEN